MAKPPVTVDRFKLSCECEVTDLGAIIAQLTKMGLTNLHFELMTDVATFRQKTNHAIKAADFLTGWIKDHPTFKAAEVIQAFKADGRTAGSGYSGLRDLVDANILKKLGEGNYARADVKAIAPPAKKAKKAKKAKPQKPVNSHQMRYVVPNPALIMRIAKRKKGHFTVADIKAAFEKDGRPPSSASPAIKDLLDKKSIKRIADGEYQIIETPAPKTNGNTVAAVEGVTNG